MKGSSEFLRVCIQANSLELTVNTSKRRHWHCFGVFVVNFHHWHRSGVLIVNFEHISQLVLVFQLLTLNS